MTQQIVIAQPLSGLHNSKRHFDLNHSKMLAVQDAIHPENLLTYPFSESCTLSLQSMFMLNRVQRT